MSADTASTKLTQDPAPEAEPTTTVIKKVRLTKSGRPDKRSQNKPPRENLSKARAALKSFIEAGKKKNNIESEADDEEESPAPAPAPPTLVAPAPAQPTLVAPAPVLEALPIPMPEVKKKEKKEKKKRVKQVIVREESSSSESESEIEERIVYRGKPKTNRKPNAGDYIQHNNALQLEMQRMKAEMELLRLETKQKQENMESKLQHSADAFLSGARSRLSIRYPNQL